VHSLQDRALRERLRRRMHLVKTRTSARNRIFGLLTQFGLRVSHPRLRTPDAMELLERRGVPAVWRASIAELLELIEEMDRPIVPTDRELGPLAREDPRAQLLATIPGVGPAKSAVARKLLIAAWHILSREQPCKPSRPSGGRPDRPGQLLPLSDRPTVRHAIDQPRPLPQTICAHNAKEK
jgi:hypothetical protein